MKFILTLALGFALGLLFDRYELSRQPGPIPGVPAAGSSFDDKMRQWHLDPDDIRQDLAKTGEVVRTHAQTVGGSISDARIVTVVKSKYVLDRDLSAADIHVSADGGRVTLTGTAASPDLIGRAVGLALDTDGVSDVSSKLAVAQH